jgi:hypothetical protein
MNPIKNVICVVLSAALLGLFGCSSNGSDATTSGSNDLSTGGQVAASCSSQVGNASAQTLVNQCLQVSTSSHPPCNVANRART